MITCMACGAQLTSIKTSHLRYNCTGEHENMKSYRLKYPNAVLVCEETRKKLGEANSESAFKKRYGEAAGAEKWKQYTEKLSNKNTLGAFLAKGKTEEDFESYNKSRAVTLENLIKKYGQEEGTRRFDSYREKQKDAGNTLDYFVKKYGADLGLEKYTEVCRQKGITLNNLIRKYGEEAGESKYEQFLEKTKGNYVSIIGLEFVTRLTHLLPSDIKSYSAAKEREFCVYDGRAFLYDFVIPDLKLAIEFNGDFWHANPKVYSENDLLRFRGNAVTASEIWQRDSIKKAVLESRGFELHVIWESEYLEDKEEVLSKCLRWILNAQKSLR